MGVSCLILGYSGSGKSTSLRNFEKDEIGIFNVAGKPLPFRKRMSTLERPDYDMIYRTLDANNKRAYVIDDANYLMAFQNFALAKQVGFGKFTDMAVNFERLLEKANATDPDTIVYFLMHPDVDDAGRIKPKSIGKMLDNQLTIEGMFPIVLMSTVDDAGYHFATQSSGNDPVKAPMDMFDAPLIDNDLKAVDSIIRDYWEMKPLVDQPAEPDQSTGADKPTEPTEKAGDVS